jgi:sulfite reductase (NADPH) flavoprotein alpha-component
MSATTLGLIALDAAQEPEVTSVVDGHAQLPAERIAQLKQVRLGELRALNFPDATDSEDTWKLTTRQGESWLDRYSGEVLATQPASTAQRLYDWALLLHAGEGAWWTWAVLLGLTGASIPLFLISGLLIWWRTRQDRPRIINNSPLAQADMLIFVASESGSTWGFAETLHDALVRAGHRVHSAPLEHFGLGPAARQVFVLAATYGEGQAPAHAGGALAHLAALPGNHVPVTVLGFGDRQFPAYCAYAEQVDALLRERGWPALLPLERIHQQSAQQFARWGEALAAALGAPLVLDYRPRLPATTELRLVSRQDYAGREGQPAAILRFAWPAQGAWDRLRGRGLARFDAGDLIAIVPPGSPVPRYYSLASGSADGFVEICVRHLPGGLCSTWLLGLQSGDHVPAFIRENPGFALPASRRPVLLIGAGTGVAPLAGFIRRNERRVPMHLWFGARDPARDYYFRPDIERWQEEGRVASVQTAFSRVPDGGGYVQDALRRDAERVRRLVAQGALVRVCGSRPMAHGVAETLDQILGALRLSVAQLKAKGRYAEDVF